MFPVGVGISRARHGYGCPSKTILVVVIIIVLLRVVILGRYNISDSLRTQYAFPVPLLSDRIAPPSKVNGSVALSSSSSCAFWVRWPWNVGPDCVRACNVCACECVMARKKKRYDEGVGPMTGVLFFTVHPLSSRCVTSSLVDRRSLLTSVAPVGAFGGGGWPQL